MKSTGMEKILVGVLREKGEEHVVAERVLMLGAPLNLAVPGKPRSIPVPSRGWPWLTHLCAPRLLGDVFGYGRSPLEVAHDSMV